MDNYQAVLDKVSVVRRFLVPIQSDDFIPGRPRCWGLAPADFALVTGGYACSSCLACWAPAILDECPVCHEQRMPERQVVERPDWTAFEAERKHAYENPERTKLRPMHELVDEISAEALEGHLPGVKRNL